MKTFLKYSGILAAVIAIVGFILMMTTPAFYLTSGDKTYYLTSTQALFGEDVTSSISIITINAGHINAVWSATLGWILAMVGIIALLLGVILPLLKVEKFAGLINLIALCALLVGGVFVFMSQPCTFTLKGASEPSNLYSDYKLNATWIIAAILYIVAGILAILPAAMDFIGGKKKKRK